MAYEFRDVMPYPGVTEGSEAEHLAPLLPAYLRYVAGEDFGRSAREFAAVARRHPAMAEARLLQGISHVLADEPVEAVAPLESVVRENPRSSAARWWLAKALLQAGRRDEGLEQVRQVVALGGDYVREARAVLDALEPAAAS